MIPSSWKRCASGNLLIRSDRIIVPATELLRDPVFHAVADDGARRARRKRVYKPISMIEWSNLGIRKETDVAIPKKILTNIGNIEKQLARRVGTLEKDVTRLTKKLEKKEHEVKKLKDKLTAKLVKNVKKKVKKAKKAVRKQLSRIG
jgi:hypothetical protein